MALHVTAPLSMHPDRWQVLYLLQTQRARTRLQVARLLGVSRKAVGR